MSVVIQFTTNFRLGARSIKRAFFELGDASQRRVAQLASSWVRSTRNFGKNVDEEPGVELHRMPERCFLGLRPPA